jgi:hypothetical protein
VPFSYARRHRRAEPGAVAIVQTQMHNRTGHKTGNPGYRALRPLCLFRPTDKALAGQNGGARAVALVSAHRPALHGRPTTPPPHYAGPALRGPGTMRRGHFTPGPLRRGGVSAGRPFRAGRWALAGLRGGSCAAILPGKCQPPTGAEKGRQRRPLIL